MEEEEITDLILLLKEANQRFLARDRKLLLTNVSERTWCGALSQHLYALISQGKYKDYYADIEYNRNDGRIKRIIDGQAEVIDITCDLIVHSRGEIARKDNLIAIEMKKSYAKEEEKQKDKRRLMALTKESFDDVWSADGKTLPEYVCGYVVGIYYEVNRGHQTIFLEYFIKGTSVGTEIIYF